MHVESSPTISNLKGRLPKIFFRESSPQISNRKECPQKIIERIKSPNLKSQGVFPYEFSQNQVPKSQIARGVSLRFFSESSPRFASRFLVLLYFGGRRILLLFTQPYMWGSPVVCYCNNLTGIYSIIAIFTTVSIIMSINIEKAYCILVPGCDSCHQ